MRKQSDVQQREATGQGRLVKEGQPDIEVQYELRTAPDNFILESSRRRSDDAFATRLEGRVHAPEGKLKELAEKGEMWTLVLETGHRLDILIEADGRISPQSALRSEGDDRPERDRAPEV